jgi:hypothetical protein
VPNVKEVLAGLKLMVAGLPNTVPLLPPPQAVKPIRASVMNAQKRAEKRRMQPLMAMMGSKAFSVEGCENEGKRANKAPSGGI